MEDVPVRDRADLIERRLVVPVDGIWTCQLAASTSRSPNQIDQADEVILASNNFRLRKASERKAVRIPCQCFQELGFELDRPRINFTLALG